MSAQPSRITNRSTTRRRPCGEPAGSARRANPSRDHTLASAAARNRVNIAVDNCMAWPCAGSQRTSRISAQVASATAPASSHGTWRMCVTTSSGISGRRRPASPQDSTLRPRLTMNTANTHTPVSGPSRPGSGERAGAPQARICSSAVTATALARVAPTTRSNAVNERRMRPSGNRGRKPADSRGMAHNVPAHSTSTSRARLPVRTPGCARRSRHAWAASCSMAGATRRHSFHAPRHKRRLYSGALSRSATSSSTSRAAACTDSGALAPGLAGLLAGASASTSINISDSPAIRDRAQAMRRKLRPRFAGRNG